MARLLVAIVVVVAVEIVLSRSVVTDGRTVVVLCNDEIRLDTKLLLGTMLDTPETFAVVAEMNDVDDTGSDMLAVAVEAVVRLYVVMTGLPGVLVKDTPLLVAESVCCENEDDITERGTLLGIGVVDETMVIVVGICSDDDE